MRSHGQERVVDAHRAGADHHRVVLDAQIAHALARERAGEPSLFATPRSNVAVERRGHLQRDVGTVVSDRPAKPFDQRFGGWIAYDVDHDSGIAQAAHAACGGPRIRVERTDHDTRDLGLDERTAARRRPAVMIARLQRDVGRRPPQVVAASARVANRFDFRVRLAGTAVPALTERDAVTYENAADGRIRHRIGGRA